MTDMEEIRKAAFTRWMARGCPSDDDWQDWFAAERRIDRYFYHSFPRVGLGTADETRIGLAVLRFIVQNGLLITPETHELRQELDNPRRRLTTLIVQQRCCLTELPPAEVPWHATEFGHFSIEFEIEQARYLGAMPVLYFNHSDTSEGGTWYLTRTLTHLSFIREKLLWKLINLGREVEQSSADANKLIELSPAVSVSPNQAKAFLDYLEVRGDFEPQQLEASIRLTSCLWGPTENLRYHSLLGYFRQREWRIIPGPERTGLTYSDLDESFKDELTHLNPTFFLKEVQVDSSRKSRVWPVRKKMSHSQVEQFSDATSKEYSTHKCGAFGHRLQFASRQQL